MREIHAVRDALLHRPEDSFVEIIIRLHVHEGIARTLRLRGAIGAPQERDDLAARAGCFRGELQIAGAVRDSVFQRPDDGIGIILIGRHVDEARLEEIEHLQRGEAVLRLRRREVSIGRDGIAELRKPRVILLAGDYAAAFQRKGAHVRVIVAVAVLVGHGLPDVRGCLFVQNEPAVTEEVNLVHNIRVDEPLIAGIAGG